MSATNEIKRQKFSAWIVFIRQFKNPLLLVFLISTVVAFILGQKTEAFAIWIVMALSITLGFWNEYQAEKIVADLVKRISFNVNVIRNGVKISLPVSQIKVGDEVAIHPGSVIPADLKIIVSENLEVNESVLTGESLARIKSNGDEVFMGTVVVGGNAHGIVIAIGTDTKYGKISSLAGNIKPITLFQQGLKDFSYLLAKIAGVTVVFVVIIGWFLHHPMVETILFALTVAMGITPELLPLIVTLSLSYGSKKLAKKDVIVKQFVSIEDLGNMEVLCTDKTGTLTEGKISLSSHLDKNGKESLEALNLGLLCNSGFAHNHVLADSIDKAIMDYAKTKNIGITGNPEKIFDEPFNYENRFMSIVVKKNGKNILICKGSPEAIITRLNADSLERSNLQKMTVKMENNGLRVIAVASREIGSFDKNSIGEKQRNLDFGGFLTFADVPKRDLVLDLKKFEKLGVTVKIITGDSEIVAEKVSDEVGFVYKKVLINSEIEKMNESELREKVWETDIFARVTPTQKVRIIEALKKGGHTIGFIGDGVNDGPALHIADVGISVNTGVDVAKDAASIVLLRKSLGAIADGIHEGRVTFQNTIKYILMGTSSSFGNMISAAVASTILPFLPMTPVQLLLNDIMYDISQTSIPTDFVDADQILRPKKWDLGYIKRFMLLFGLIGMVYDFLTFAVMYFIFHARGSLFQTGWFVTSFITEVLVVFVIRTKKIPFWKSKTSAPFLLTCLSVVFIALFLPISPLATHLGFTPLPAFFFIYLMGITVTYLFVVEVGKYFLNKGRFD